MPDFNAIWQQYQPILQQYRDDIAKRQQDLTNMQASGNTFEDQLKARIAGVKSITEPAIQAKNAALQNALNAPQEGQKLYSDIQNPLARQQAIQPMVSRAVADYTTASDRLKQAQTPNAQLMQSAVNARVAEQARAQGILQAAQDRYSLLQQEFQTGYQMAQDEWNRNMQEEQLALQKQSAGRAASSDLSPADYAELISKSDQANQIASSGNTGSLTPYTGTMSNVLKANTPQGKLNLITPEAVKSKLAELVKGSGKKVAGALAEMIMTPKTDVTQPTTHAEYLKDLELQLKAQGQDQQAKLLTELDTDFGSGMPLDKAYIMYPEIDRNTIKALWDSLQ